jgi:hypothetical protein
VTIFYLFIIRIRPKYLDHGDVHTLVPIHCQTRRRLVVAPPTFVVTVGEVEGSRSRASESCDGA